MNRARFGAIRRTYLCALALTLSAFPLFSQVVERGRTYADLVSSHPCNSGNSGRLARVTDAQSSSSIGGGGGSTQVWAVCDGVDTWTLTNIGSAGGGAATAVTGSATLPATCTEKDLYQDTDSGGTEFYVCTATNTWTKTGTGAGDVVGPSSATDNAIARFDATTGKLIQNSVATLSDAGALVLPIAGSIFVTVAGTDGGVLISSGGTINGIAAGGSVSYQLLMTNDAWGRLGSGKTLNWNSATDMNSGSLDTGVGRSAAGVVKATNGSTGLGWFQQHGNVALASDFTNATATPANLTGLTVTLNSGRKYTFALRLSLIDSVAGEGLRIDFDGGTATATDFTARCKVHDTALLLATTTTAIATDVAVATATGASDIECFGSFEVNAAGTFIPRAAQNSHATGTLTVDRGSYLHVTDSSFN